MGLKAFREHFGITGKVYIEFGSVIIMGQNNQVLAQLYRASGLFEYTPNVSWVKDGRDRRALSRLMTGEPAKVLELLAALDKHEELSDVFIIEKGMVINKHQAEVVAVGHATTEGVQLREGTFFAKFEEAKEALVADLKAHLQLAESRLKAAREDLGRASQSVDWYSKLLEHSEHWHAAKL